MRLLIADQAIHPRIRHFHRELVRARLNRLGEMAIAISMPYWSATVVAYSD